MRGRKRQLSLNEDDRSAKIMRHEEITESASRSGRVRKVPAKLLDGDADSPKPEIMPTFNDENDYDDYDSVPYHQKSPSHGRGRSRRGRPPKTVQGFDRVSNNFNKSNALLFDYDGDDDELGAGNGLKLYEEDTQQTYGMKIAHQKPLKLKLSKVKSTNQSHIWQGAYENNLATDEEDVDEADSDSQQYDGGEVLVDEEEEDVEVDDDDDDDAAYHKSAYSPLKKGSKTAVKSNAVSRQQLIADKRKRRVTAYVLFCNESRSTVQEMYPTMDYGEVSRKLGEMWHRLPLKEHLKWKRKAKKGGMLSPAATTTDKRGTDKRGSLTTQQRSPVELSEKVAQKILALEQAAHNFKVTGCKAIDVAAHLRLLGDSLSTIGMRLVEHKGQIAVSGSLSVLLDSILCALGSLMCLTREVVELQAVPDNLHCSTLDNLAYIMPGLG